MRPQIKLGIVCAALVAGEALGLVMGSWSALWLPAMFLAVLTLAFGYGHAMRFWPVAFFFLLGVALMLRAEHARREAWRAIELKSGRLVGSFLVLGEPRVGAHETGGTRWVSFPTEFAGGKLKVVFRQATHADAPQVGETWRCAGWVDGNKEERYRTQRLWVKGKDSFAACAKKVSPLAPRRLLARIKRNLSYRMGRGLQNRPQAADLNRAMVLGERTMLPWELRQDFIRSGTMHVFAISGLHVMVVAQFALYALVLMMFPVRWAGLVLIPFLWLYAALIGFPASAVRAVAMASLYYAAPFFCRRPDSLVAWEWTLLAFALLDPIGLFGVGSMLSFTVVFGILLFVRWARPFESRLLLALGCPFAAWAAGVPIAAHVFARVTPGGLLANLIEVPLAGLAVMTSVAGLVASFVSDALASHLNGFAALLTEVLSGVSWTVARLPGADLEIAPWSVPLCAAWYVGIIAAFLWAGAVCARRRAQI